LHQDDATFFVEASKALPPTQRSIAEFASKCCSAPPKIPPHEDAMLTRNYDVIRQRNRQAQRRYCERHIMRRRIVQRIVNILLRRSWSGERFEMLGALLDQLMNRQALRSLRRALRETRRPTPKEQAAQWREQEKRWRELWLRTHSGKTDKDFRALSDDEYWAFRRAQAKRRSRPNTRMGARPSRREVDRASVRDERP
jgi:hypothetical protein